MKIILLILVIFLILYFCFGRGEKGSFIKKCAKIILKIIKGCAKIILSILHVILSSPDNTIEDIEREAKRKGRDDVVEKTQNYKWSREYADSFVQQAKEKFK